MEIQVNLVIKIVVDPANPEQKSHTLVRAELIDGQEQAPVIRQYHGPDTRPSPVTTVSEEGIAAPAMTPEEITAPDALPAGDETDLDY